MHAKNMLFSLLTLFVTQAAIGIEISKPTPELPAEILSHIVPFVADSNVSMTAKTIQSLAMANKQFHDILNNPTTMRAILQRMPYTANAIDLADKLKHMPVMQDPIVKKWVEEQRKGVKDSFELNFAAWSGDPEKIQELLKNKNIDLNSQSSRLNGDTALIKASSNAHEKIVELLLQAGADPNIKGSQGMTALMNAANWGFIAIAKLLLNAGADPDIKDNKGRTARSIAKQAGYQNFVDILDAADAKRK